MGASPEGSWLFFKARAKRPYLSHTGRASNEGKQPPGPGQEGCVENGTAAELLIGYVSIHICALLAPCRQPILNATTSPLFARRGTSCTFVLCERWEWEYLHTYGPFSDSSHRRPALADDE